MKFNISGRRSVRLDRAAEEEFNASSLRRVKIRYTWYLLNRLECSFMTIDAIPELFLFLRQKTRQFRSANLTCANLGETRVHATSGFAHRIRAACALPIECLLTSVSTQGS